MSRRLRRLALCLGAVAALAAGGPTGHAGADPAPELRLVDVRLVDDDGGWRASNQFEVRWGLAWTYRRGEHPPPVLEFRVEGPDGTPVGPTASQPSAERRLTISIPPGPDGGDPPPGAYRLSLWLHNDQTGADGPRESVTLRLDRARPAAVRPLAPAGWLRAGADVELRIEHPGDPRPLSGIRGYAVVLDHGSGAEPCAGPVCEDAEIDLDGGEDDDSIVLGPLGEGTNVARVVAVSGTGMHSQVAEAATLHVDGTPPSVAILGAPAGWSSRAVEVTASASDPLSGVVAAGPSGPITGISVDGAEASISSGDRASATVHGDGAHVVTGFARDAVGNLGAADPAAARHTVWIDETAPRVAFAATRDPARPERIVAQVDDPLSGPSARRGSIAIRPAGSGVPFEPLPTTVEAGRLTADWDSDRFPRGSYEFRAVAFDVAGNRSATTRRAGGEAMVLDNPVKAPAALAVGFGGRRFVAHLCGRRGGRFRCHNRVITAFADRPAATMVGYGKRAPVAGRLTDAAGAPLAGLPVAITETFASGSEPSRRTTTVTTGGDGFFLARLAPGPDRRIELAFAGTPTLTAAGGSELRLGVRSAVHLRASSATAAVGGSPVVFNGRVGGRGASFPADGIPVELEFRVAGLPWSEFRTVQTDARGRFRLPYAFSDDDSRGVRFQFRAHVAGQPGWPYDPAHSLPVAVTGR